MSWLQRFELQFGLLLSLTFTIVLLRLMVELTCTFSNIIHLINDCFDIVRLIIRHGMFS